MIFELDINVDKLLNQSFIGNPIMKLLVNCLVHQIL